MFLHGVIDTPFPSEIRIVIWKHMTGFEDVDTAAHVVFPVDSPAVIEEVAKTEAARVLLEGLSL